MTRSGKRRLKRFLGIWLVTFVLASLSQGDKSNQNVFQNAFLSLPVVLGIGWVHGRILPRLRRLPLLLATLLAGAAFFAALVAAIVFCVWILVIVHSGNPLSPMMGEEIDHLFFSEQGRSGLLYTYVFILSVTFGLEILRRIGPQRLFSWLLGRYRNPKEERRVFLFIDLSGSTPLAESLGSLRFSAFLRDFFHGLTGPVDETDGEIVSYVGDEAILSWPERRGFENGNALRCYLLFRQRIEEDSAHFLKEYGEVPRYKAAIHAGPVVATEVGQRKTDLVLHGDALNTTARILGECDALGAQLLISEETARQLPPVEGVSLEPVGSVELRGKSEPVRLVRAKFE
ncbi:adenylate/guanylate cyclase domain-containing protein, partial [bacterium]